MFQVDSLLAKKSFWAEKRTNLENPIRQNCWIASARYRFLNHKTNNQTASPWSFVGTVLNPQKHYHNQFVVA